MSGSKTWPGPSISAFTNVGTLEEQFEASRTPIVADVPNRALRFEGDSRSAHDVAVFAG